MGKGNERTRITSIVFKNFKAFKSFSVTLRPFNVLVGPNNCGKSTIVVAIRMLAEALRKANTKAAEPVRTEGKAGWGYRISLAGLPVASENLFHNYDDSEPASVSFRLSPTHSLTLHFPEQQECILVCRTEGRQVRTPSDFRREFPIRIGFVPILGPVEPDEPLYKEEAARLALITHRASRNFRNIWHHFSEEFAEFRQLIIDTWPGMDISKPEIQAYEGKGHLKMFCPEERFPRELYWSGYGFQVWCQMLTFIVKSKNASLLVIDEPDIYLHSDLQRQLVALLRSLGPDVVIATHSTEIIAEAEPGELLAVNKKWRAARLLKDTGQIQNLFATLGSSLNPTLTQLAKTRRVLFVEGKDFQMMSGFARKLGMDAIANRRDFAVIPVDGFNPRKLLDLSEGMEATLGAKLTMGAIFDRDYRTDAEVGSIHDELAKVCQFVAIHDRKEIENYVCDPRAIERAIDARIEERATREGVAGERKKTGADLLAETSQEMKNDILGQYLARWVEYERKLKPGKDTATLNAAGMKEFEKRWGDDSERLKLLPGKQILAAINRYTQESHGVTITALQIIKQMRPADVPGQMKTLLGKIQGLCAAKQD